MGTKKQARVSGRSSVDDRQDRKECSAENLSEIEWLRARLLALELTDGSMSANSYTDGSRKTLLTNERTGQVTEVAGVVESHDTEEKEQDSDFGWTRVYGKWLISLVDSGALIGEIEHRLLLRMIGASGYSNIVTVSAREIARKWGNAVHANVSNAMKSLEQKNIIRRIGRAGKAGVRVQLNVDLCWKGETVDRYKAKREWHMKDIGTDLRKGVKHG